MVGPTLAASPVSVPSGGTVTATWSGIASPTATDWIGLYQPGAGNTSFIAWIYVSCSQTPGSPQAAGSCSFVLPGSLLPGSYELRLLANDGFTVIVTSNAFTVTGGGGGPTLTVSPTSIPPGGTLTTTWSGIASPTATDWIGLYQPGAGNTSFIAWIYVSCSQTPGSPQAAGSCSFVLPGSLLPGSYELRLLANDGFTVIVTSNAFTVTGGGGGPTLICKPDKHPPWRHAHNDVERHRLTDCDRLDRLVPAWRR